MAIGKVLVSRVTVCWWLRRTKEQCKQINKKPDRQTCKKVRIQPVSLGELACYYGIGEFLSVDGIRSMDLRVKSGRQLRVKYISMFLDKVNQCKCRRREDHVPGENTDYLYTIMLQTDRRVFIASPPAQNIINKCDLLTVTYFEKEHIIITRLTIHF